MLRTTLQFIKLWPNQRQLVDNSLVLVQKLETGLAKFNITHSTEYANGQCVGYKHDYKGDKAQHKSMLPTI